MKAALNGRLMRLLLTGKTDLLRFFFALCSFGFSFWVAFDPSYPLQHQEAIAVAPAHAQIILFTIHGFSLLYGVLTCRYSIALLFTEGVLGVFLWCGIGIAEWHQQGVPGPMFMAGLIALFLLIRYPTHYGVDTDGI